MNEERPPYPTIARLLKRGEIIVFLGAGASLSGRPPDAQWDERAPFLPLGDELSRRLADDSSFPSPDADERGDLPKVASYYTEAVDRPNLLAFMRDILDRDYQLGEIHRFLAEVLPMLGRQKD